MALAAFGSRSAATMSPVREADRWRGAGGTGRFPRLAPSVART
jgi:hypothetical protein